MTIGSLGEILFYVTDSQVLTIKEATWKVKATYSTHKMHGTRSKLEFTGLEPQELEFQIIASAYLGVDPMTIIDDLNMLLESHQVVQFLLGNDVIGTSWVVAEISHKLNRFWKDGTVLGVEVTVKIKEYGEDSA